jgi:tRNA G37 N-methylase Trm5
VNVTSCEINKTAFGFHIENNALNKVEGKVKTLNIDASELSQRTKDRFNRILLPNPSQANLFLTKAVHLARPAAYIHYYRHLSGESLEEAKEKMKQEVSEHVRGWSKLDVRRVREVGPRWHELVADIQVN